MTKKSEQERASNVVKVGSMTNSALQQDSPGASQNLNIGSTGPKAETDQVVNEVLAAIEQLGLDEGQKAEMRAEAETIQAQMKLEKPKPLVIKACLEGIKGIILGGAMVEGRKLGAILVEKINDLVGRL